MKRSCAVMVVLVLVLLAGAGKVLARGVPELSNVRGSNTFSFELLHALQERDARSNVFVSPYSIYVAMAMLYNGVDGVAMDEMSSALHYLDGDPAMVNAEQLALQDLLRKGGCKLDIDVANSLWIDSSQSVRDEYRNILKKYYGADIFQRYLHERGVVAEINKWVSDKTRKMIPYIIQNLDINSLFVLINAVYFKGSWMNPFDSRFTQAETFTDYDGIRKTVPMMHEKSKILYMEDEDIKAIRLLFGKGDAAMYVILPHSGRDVNSVIAGFDEELLAELIEGMDKQEVTLSLPRFQIEYYPENLKNVMKALGIKSIFDKGFLTGVADNENLFLMTVNHKAVIEIDELGAKAAAASALAIGAYDDRPLRFKADRPFFFVIRHEATGTILFMGKLLYP